jgi:hypothetical protein
VALLGVYGGLALTVDFPRAGQGIQSDEATYYMMGHSLAEDGDLTYHREDLVRVWREFPSGPTGLFLKRGRDVLDAGIMRRPPFVWTRSQPDGDQSRLFYGKAFIYPLFAAPFVRVFGTNGFFVLHALLLALATWCSYLFLHARMRALPAAALAGAFVMASVVPVYFVWIMPEVFNFSLALIAYFCWLYKDVAPPSHVRRWSRWLFGSSSDLVAAVLLGILTFSKISNLLLLLPILVFQLVKRRWPSFVATAVLFGLVAGGLFAVNMAISGEWNYQGGERRTFLWEFPFQTPTSNFEKGSLMGRNDALTDVSLDRRVFWTNLTHNMWYALVGRYAGLLAYFFPSVFAALALLARPRRRSLWQYLVLASAIGQVLLFIINLPYTWGGGGGSVGNRYFMSAYGICLFMIPPLTRAWLVAIPWLVGGLFTAQMVLNPFATSHHPGDYASHGPLRLLPVELTMVNDLPIMTDATRVRLWFGDDPVLHDPGFQIYFLDDNAFGREEDRSFWVKGESRAEFLVKTDRPMKRLVLTLSSPIETRVTASAAGRQQEAVVRQAQQISFALTPGFWYEARAFVWVVSVSSSAGFVPALEVPGGSDTRYLGVRVKPTLVE